MKKRNTFLMNVRSGLGSLDFVFAAIGIAVLCYVSVSPYLGPKETWGYGNLITTFNLLIDLSAFKKILVILAATPFAASFCNDWNCQYIRPVVIRTGIRNYIWSKVTACTATAIITVFLGLALFIGFMSIWIPLLPTNPNETLTMIAGPHFVEIASLSPLLYLITNFFLFSLGCAFWVISGLAISAYIAIPIENTPI